MDAINFDESVPLFYAIHSNRIHPGRPGFRLVLLSTFLHFANRSRATLIESGFRQALDAIDSGVSVPLFPRHLLKPHVSGVGPISGLFGYLRFCASRTIPLPQQSNPAFARSWTPSIPVRPCHFSAPFVQTISGWFCRLWVCASRIVPSPRKSNEADPLRTSGQPPPSSRKQAGFPSSRPIVPVKALIPAHARLRIRSPCRQSQSPMSYRPSSPDSSLRFSPGRSTFFSFF